jgi:hypothetical protein
MASRQKGVWQKDEMITRQVDETVTGQNNRLMKWQVGKMVNR